MLKKYKYIIYITFLKTVLEKDYKDVNGTPLSSNTVSKRVDEMAGDVERQLVEKLRSRKLDESAVRDKEAILMACVG